MGSRSNNNLAYIAGFLDGDGSLMLQIKKRSDSKIGIRFMVTICLYQDTRHEKELYWIRKVLGIGYISQRNDGMSELRINGYKKVHEILVLLQPFIRFKRIQTKALLRACEVLKSSTISSMTEIQLRTVLDCVVIIRNENYSTQKKRSKKELYKMFGLTP